MRRLFETLNTPMAVLTALVLVVAIDCYLLFFREYKLRARITSSGSEQLPL